MKHVSNGVKKNYRVPVTGMCVMETVNNEGQ